MAASSVSGTGSPFTLGLSEREAAAGEDLSGAWHRTGL